MKWTFLFVIAFSFTFLKSSAQCDSINHWESIVIPEQEWQYYHGLIDPGNNWMNASFDANNWNTGNGGFGYGDNDDNTTIPATITVYLRKTFQISDLNTIQKLVLNIDYDDGYVAYINGIEVARRNMGDPNSATNNLQTATAFSEAQLPIGNTPENVLIDPSLLTNGSNIIAVEVHNEGLTSSDLSSNVWLQAGITNNTNLYNPIPNWFIPPLNFVSSHLPIVLIETNNQTIVDEPKITANMKVVNTGSLNTICQNTYEYDGNIGIEIRGNSSQEYPKKQYTVETRDAFGDNLNVSLLGMPEENDWILYAPYSDKTLMRNVVTYELASQMFDYAPRTRFCEVVINGEYLGVFVLTEKIKRDANRLNINKLKSDEISGDNVTGGYILLKDRTPQDYQGGFLSHYPASNGFGELFYRYEYPDANDIVPEQEDYIETYVDDFERALKGSEFSDPNIGYAPFIDIESFVNYFIITEFTKDIDGYRLSTYFHKDKESLGGKLKMGPVWDFNIAYGNSFACGSFLTNGSVLSMSDSCGVQFPFWWQRLPEDDTFFNQLICNWKAYRSSFLSDESIVTLIDSKVEELGPSINRNFQRWPVLGEYVWPNYIVHDTYLEEINYLKQWMTERLAYLDVRFDGTCSVNIDEFSTNSTWKVGPNPFTEDARISGVITENSALTITLFNSLGQELGKGQANASTGNVNFSISQLIDYNLSSGIYVITIADEHKQLSSIKLIKQ